MAQVIVSAGYFGTALRVARRKNNIPKNRFKQLFDCDEKQYHRYEYGMDLIPHDVLQRIFTYAARMHEKTENE